MEEGRTEATHTYTVGLVAGETKPALKVLELCDRHDKLAGELAGILAGIGQTPALPAKVVAPAPTPPPSRPSWDCPLCGEHLGRNVAVAHVWNRHRRDVRPEIPKRCPDCGHPATGQGMTAHRRSAHGYDALADALSGAR